MGQGHSACRLQTHAHNARGMAQHLKCNHCTSCLAITTVAGATKKILCRHGHRQGMQAHTISTLSHPPRNGFINNMSDPQCAFLAHAENNYCWFKHNLIENQFCIVCCNINVKPMQTCEILRWHSHTMGVDVNASHTNSFPNVEWLSRQTSRSYRMSFVPTQKHTRLGIIHNPTYIQFHGTMVYKIYPQKILHIGISTHLLP